ncbi:MAG: leucine-rich repeat protein [Christensenellaceae bacterium]|nr:leucine-rich repeat protein [Christensenellaceae bacterium]
MSIPENIDGLNITEISTNAFLNNSIIEKLIIPEGVKKIHKDAIVNCKFLNDIELPKSLNFIDVNAFRNVEDKTHGDGIQPTYKVDARSYAFGFVLENRYKYSTIEPKSNFEYAKAKDAKANVVVGDIVSLTIPETNYGGTPPYQYTTYIYCNDSVVEHMPFTSSRIVTYRFTSPGNYKIKTWVRDSNKIVVNSINPAVYTVSGAPTPLQVYGTVNSANVVLGNECIFYAHPSGGAAPYTYAYYLYKDNVRIATTSYTNNIYYTYKPTAAGNYHAMVFAKDSLGNRVSSISPTISVQPSSPLSINVTVNKAHVNLNEKIIFTATASNGLKPYSYAYYLYKDGTNIYKSTYSQNNIFTYTPVVNGVYTVTAFVKDSKNIIAYKNSAKVTAGVVSPLTVVASANKNNMLIGESVTFSANASGGIPPYYYAYYIFKDNVPIHKGSYSKVNSFTYIPTSAGTYRATAFVKDSSNTIVFADTPVVNVGGSSAPLSLIATATPSGQYIGDTITFKGLATGGKAPYSYAFYVYKDNVKVLNYWYTSNSQYNYTPTSAGVYHANVFVKDSAGKIVWKATTKINIQAGSIPPLTITSNADKTTMNVNETVSVIATANGGVPPYQYAYYVIKDNVAIHKGTYGINSIFTYTPTLPGTYKITSFVRDSRNIRTSHTTGNIVVSAPAPQPITVYATIDNVNFELGGKVTVRAFASGGVSPYKYAFHVINANTNAIVYTTAYSDSNTFIYTPTAAGTYKFKAYVKDKTDTVVSTESTNFIVTVPVRKVTLNASISGNILTLNANVTGYGSTPPIEYAFYIYKDDVLILQDSVYRPSPAYHYNLTQSGVYSGFVFVKYNGIPNIDTAASNTVPFTYVPAPKYRALLIGNSDYPGTGLDLPGCAQDVIKMYSRLSTKGPFGAVEIKKHDNLYAPNLVPAINTAFSGADANSVSIFYYTGHALETGFLMGTDNQTVSPATLANALRSVPGKVIVLLDCCHSGLYINKSNTTNDDAYKKFNQSVINAFRNVDVQSRAGELLESKFHVITSSRKDQQSYATNDGSFFTTGLLLAGDTDNNGFISMYEAYISGKSYAQSQMGELQIAQAYPNNDSLELFKN